ncbi:MAG TPA: serine hydrolase domain-containing protein [Pseudonocardia sp.]|nr:serine hydrolase domain-containing protein [Pseudonocardia sp.]
MTSTARDFPEADMRRGLRTGAVMLASTLVLGTACSAPVPTTPAAPPPQPAYAATVQQRITQAMKDNAIPGAVVLVRSPERGDWAGTFGTGTIGQNAPLSLDDYFRVGSNTKTMTVTVILQLVQEGRLKLDDPIDRYQPGVPGGSKITIAQLAEMRSGLYSYTFDRGFNEALDQDPGHAWTPAELLRIAFAHPAQFAPGERFEYCNTNTVLLGLVIEHLTGKPLAQALRERIFTPLGLAHTSLPVNTDVAIPNPHPRGYAFGTNISTIDTSVLPEAEQKAALAGTLLPHDETDANPSWTWAAGGAISTAGDLATYVKALVAGGMLDATTQRLRLDSIRSTNPEQPQSAGYGLGIAQFGPLLGHDGQLPGYMTFMGYDPGARLTIVIGTNLAAVPAGEGSALVLLRAMLPVFYGAGIAPGGDPAAPASDPAAPEGGSAPPHN